MLFTTQVIAWTIGAIILGALLYPLLMMARERRWCRFVGISPHEYKVRAPHNPYGNLDVSACTE